MVILKNFLHIVIFEETELEIIFLVMLIYKECQQEEFISKINFSLNVRNIYEQFRRNISGNNSFHLYCPVSIENGNDFHTISMQK